MWVRNPRERDMRERERERGRSPKIECLWLLGSGVRGVDRSRSCYVSELWDYFFDVDIEFMRESLWDKRLASL